VENLKEIKVFLHQQEPSNYGQWMYLIEKEDQSFTTFLHVCIYIVKSALYAEMFQYPSVPFHSDKYSMSVFKQHK